MTEQRRVIARGGGGLRSSDAEELYRRAIAVDPHSIATVYRTQLSRMPAFWNGTIFATAAALRGNRRTSRSSDRCPPDASSNS
jgi:hypothetical protein